MSSLSGIARKYKGVTVIHEVISTGGCDGIDSKAKLWANGGWGPGWWN